MSVVDASYDQPLKIEEAASMPLAGGIMGYGYQCGMLWGGALAAGAQAHRMHGGGRRAEAEAVVATQRLVESFRARNQYVDCSDITEVEWKKMTTGKALKYVATGGPIGCFRMAAAYAPAAFNAIDASLSEDHHEAPPHPVSCTALLAERRGATDLRRVMVAGFAGGIGLSGAACGALGAAIWLDGIRTLEAGGKIAFDFNSPAHTAVVEKYLEASDYEFECAAVVGRVFESVFDHAEYVRNGGCSQIIEALSAV